MQIQSLSPANQTKHIKDLARQNPRRPRHQTSADLKKKGGMKDTPFSTPKT
jgi:hypothetical protein